MPDPTDLHVGGRLRQRRLLVGMTQEGLAEKVGVSFQMVQKYEKGACRVGASRLMMIAQALGVPASYFFEGLKGAGKGQKVAEDAPRMDEDIMTQKETIDLLKAYYALPENARKGILSMVKGLKKGGK
jgi:transcriptional regulator with XRE-family HTH domain